jgi:hypothetical protein
MSRRSASTIPMARDGPGRRSALQAVPEPKRHENRMHVAFAVEYTVGHLEPLGPRRDGLSEEHRTSRPSRPTLIGSTTGTRAKRQLALRIHREPPWNFRGSGFAGACHGFFDAQPGRPQIFFRVRNDLICAQPPGTAA